MLKNRWWGLMCLCMTMALHGCPLEVEQEIGNNDDDAGMGEGGQGGQGGNAEGGEGGQGGNPEGGEGGQGGQGAEGGQGGQGAEGGQGGQGAEGGQGGQGAEGGQGGQGGGEPGCPEGFEEVDSPNQCDEGQECFPLEDGRWCRGPIEPGECPDGYELAQECRPDADCIPLADGLFCVGEPQGGECPDGFQPVDECPADAECVLTNDGQMCARFGGPQGCPEGFEEVDNPDECWWENGDEPADPIEPGFGECIEIDGLLCRAIRDPQCPEGFELTDQCDADREPGGDECFPIDNGLFCQWIGQPQGCPQGFVEVEDPAECFEDGQDPNDPIGGGQCIEINGRLCREINNPQECPDGFELTDWCDEDQPDDECFPIGDGLFCRWNGDPQGCPQGFVEVNEPDECFEDGQDPADPNGFGECIEINGRLCREVNNPQDCPDGFELTDWCDEDRGNECFPIGDGLFCQRVDNPQECPAGFVEVPECNDETECIWLDDGRMCQWIGQQGCPEGFEPVDNPDECWWENGAGQDPDEAAPPAGDCIEVNGMLCRPADEPRCPEGFELTDWCDEDDAAEQQCFAIDDGLFCRWNGEPQGCPAGFEQVDPDACVDDNNNDRCECIDSNGDGQCDLWCREARNAECPPGFHLADWCDEDFAGECFEIDNGLFCQRDDDQPQGCPAGFEQADEADCIDDNNNNHCECIDSNGDGECDLWCREARNVECPDGFELSDWCDADSPNECFQIDDGLFCQWVGEPQGCPAGFEQVDQCDPALGECFQAEDGTICQQFGDPQGCPDGYAEGCDPDRQGECIDLPTGEVCQEIDQNDACPEGFEHAAADECNPNQNECVQTADGQWCIWRG